MHTALKDSTIIGGESSYSGSCCSSRLSGRGNSHSSGSHHWLQVNVSGTGDSMAGSTLQQYASRIASYRDTALQHHPSHVSY